MSRSIIVRLTAEYILHARIGLTFHILAVFGEIVIATIGVLSQLTQELVSLRISAVEADGVDGYRLLQGNLG